ncbi:ergothioneine biosynthesis protein EgtC [Actinophytocola gossypii]|uniref:Gamma-glutamyl-hercynylcysteine sulfoxide hydrolase n=1 Tax=Actinophytocola gossypii TaxID=2812003 RepID=A0ABT2JI55_9PSEU|nr:ergothioneine biosynthesis protein EgtC [Actinophytocola gossypii]MCT2587080.1 ergothioneine biosynthesis protein EgtC [Actinophytocola gossypii]
MCRHLAYLGEPVPLADLLLNPGHSLLCQSWAPRDMRGGGTVNADGFGIGWYTGSSAEPALLRRAVPMWTDTALPRLATEVSSGGVLAAVRSATVGMPVVETAAAPFARGPWLFSHNGVVRGWPSSVVPLASTLPVESLLTMDAPTDSALLWALLRHRLDAGDKPADAVSSLVLAVEAAAPGSRLNLLLTDGHTVVGTAWTHALWVRRSPEGVAVASEPYDDHPSWREVPDRHLVVTTSSTVDITPIGEP